MSNGSTRGSRPTLGTMTGATEVRVVLREPDTDAVAPARQRGSRRTAEQAGLPLTPLRLPSRPASRSSSTTRRTTNGSPVTPTWPGSSTARCWSCRSGSRAADGDPLLENRLGPGAFTAERVEAVQFVAAQLAVSLDNAQLFIALEREVEQRTAALAVANERLDRLSVTDPLTGLANRRRLSDVLDSEWWRAVRPQLPLAIAAIDVDHFTEYNDGYGHLAGDRCLQRVAAAISECVRTMDLVARYGGESFAVVLPTVDEEVGQIIAERIRDAVVALEEPHERSPFGFVTVSVGVISAVPSWDGNPQTLLDAADERLSLAKRRGRNLVVAGYPFQNRALKDTG